MKQLLYILLCFSFGLSAQDKVFFRDGSVKKGILLSVASDYIYFKQSDTSATQKISKSKIALIEDYKGTRYLFSGTAAPAIDSSRIRPQLKEGPRNILSLQPISLVLGRATIVYERLNRTRDIGVAIPFSLTYDPFGLLYQSELDTNGSSIQRIKGVNYITGADINFYIGKGETVKFFLGPRFRYGTDLFLRNLKGYSLQTQLGWISMREGKSYTQHFSIGFGFVRVIEAPGGMLVDPKQSYPWISLNYRMGFSW